MGNMPHVRKGARTVGDIISVFENELEELPDDLHSKYAKLEGIVEELHKANLDEQAAKKALNNYESSLQANYGSLTDKVQEISWRYETFNELAQEVDEIKESQIILAYEKQPKEKVPPTLTDGQINNISTKLEKQRTKLRHTGRDAHYSQERLDQIVSRSEDAKSQLYSIIEEIPHYQNNSKLTEPIK